MVYNEKKVKLLRQIYPKGTRICLDSMENDPFPILSGSKGTVDFIDDAGNLIMKWDNGRSLSLIPGEDTLSILFCNFAPVSNIINSNIKMMARFIFLSF